MRYDPGVRALYPHIVDGIPVIVFELLRLDPLVNCAQCWDGVFDERTELVDCGALHLVFRDDERLFLVHTHPRLVLDVFLIDNDLHLVPFCNECVEELVDLFFKLFPCLFS